MILEKKYVLSIAKRLLYHLFWCVYHERQTTIWSLQRPWLKPLSEVRELMTLTITKRAKVQ